MSNFFDSEIVQEELNEINELQREVYGKILNVMNLTTKEQVEHIDKLKLLLEKQKVMYTRLSLSDDPQALKLRNQIEQSVVMMGFPQGTDVNMLFDGMDKTINDLKKHVD
jgi:hypothetical protein|tara:strand:+ start:250 stop:579 length:330 start_codon:yes stop_codon:yes gene_type:complete